jgi:beta-N-acetylglucosaminidase
MGMGLYSKKFKIYIGGAKFIKNSYIILHPAP